MKKWSMLILFALMLTVPLGGSAQEIPDLLSAVAQGLSDGLSKSAEALYSQQDLTLDLSAQDARIEEGSTLLLTLTAVNPYPQDTPVELTLSLPDRLSCTQPLTFCATLPAAASDPQTGKTVPSSSVFTREVTLVPGGSSEQADITAEMNLGTRFYRANTTIDLCVPVISARACVADSQQRLLEAGDVFAYRIEIDNDGTAPKDVGVKFILPAGVSLSGDLPDGFVLDERTIAGNVLAEAASSIALDLTMQVANDALNGSKELSRLLAAVLTVDGQRVAMPLLRVVSPMISAKLTPSQDSLEEGGTMDLAITVVNTGLADADVTVSCRLPEGLTALDTSRLAEAPSTQYSPATEDEAQEAPILPASDDSLPPGTSAAPVMAENAEAVMRTEDDALVFDIHMDAAKETDAGVVAATEEIILRVRAEKPLENIGERTLGASLAWRTNQGETQLGEAAVLRVSRAGFLGMSSGEWNGILLATLLMLVTVCCLCSAVKSDNKQDDYCFE